MKNPHKGHRDRVKKKYLKQGLDGFHDHEVLELLLYYCYSRCDTNPIAHKMLDKFGSLHNLFDSDVHVLEKELKCTENIAILINLIPALAKRYALSKWGHNAFLDNIEKAAGYALDLFIGDTVEYFYVLCLNVKNKLIYASQISKGTLDEAAVYKRTVVEEVIKYKASKVILVHNHPSGSIRPSNADNEATREIAEALRGLKVDVVDHIIVAGDKYYSYASRGVSGIIRGYPF